MEFSETKENLDHGKLGRIWRVGNQRLFCAASERLGFDLSERFCAAVLVRASATAEDDRATEVHVQRRLPSRAESCL